MKSIALLPAAALLRRLLPPLLLALGLAGACGNAAAKACERPVQLKFSVIPQGGMQQNIASLRPLLLALEEALRIPVIAVKSGSYGAVAEGLLSGAVDVARLGPALYVSAKDADPRITAFASYARRADIFNQESATYHSLLIVKAAGADSDLHTLRGQKLALVDPDSTSGAVIPRRMVMQETKQDLERFFGQVVYTGSHRTSIQALLNGDVDAAFTSSSHLSDLVEAEKLRLSDIRILWRSAAIPRDPFVYRGQLCEDLRQKIAAVFFKQNGQHFKSLLNDLNATRFVPVTGKEYHILRVFPAQEPERE